MEIDIFVAQCKDILARKGEDVQCARVMGYIAIPAVQYADDTITISQARHDGKDLFEVVVRYKDVCNGKEHDIDNPCLMIIDGEVIRYHGDCQVYGEPHVNILTV